jgi:hypothetical protein
MTVTDSLDDPLMVPRRLRPGQRTEVWIVDVDRAGASCVYTTDAVLLEAPNWAPDGGGLLLNGDGVLWRLDLEPEVELNVVPMEDLPPVNNDHVLDPPRGLIYMSANDGHIYACRPTESWRATSVSRRGRSDTRRTSTSRSGWSGRPTGARSSNGIPCSGARGPSTSTAGRPGVVASRTSRTP